MVQVLDRLAPQDFYKQLDWLRDEWDDDEAEVTRKIARLRRLYEHLPTRYYERSIPLIESLCYARLVNAGSYLPTLLELRGLVSQWDRDRPPILHCEICGADVRGERFMRQHKQIFHDGEAGT